MTMTTVNRPNEPNVTLSDFAEYAKDWNDIGRGKAIHLEGANNHGLKFNSTSGDERWIKHTPQNQRNNNAIRNAFLNAIKWETGLEVNEFPKALKSVLNISAFGLVNNQADSGKPLTAYRINAVCTALKSDEVQNEIAKIKGQKCIDRMKAITERVYNDVATKGGGDMNMVKDSMNVINKGVKGMVDVFISQIRTLGNQTRSTLTQGKKDNTCGMLQDQLDNLRTGAFERSGLRDAQSKPGDIYVVLGSSKKVPAQFLINQARILITDREAIEKELQSIQDTLMEEYKRIFDVMMPVPKNSLG